MNINSVQGASAYTNVQNPTPTADDTRVSEQNLETPRTELNNESTAAQQAFEVNITPEAQRLSTEASEANLEVAEQAAAQPPENQANQNTPPAHETNRIVNIVA